MFRKTLGSELRVLEEEIVKTQDCEHKAMVCVRDEVRGLMVQQCEV